MVEDVLNNRLHEAELLKEILLRHKNSRIVILDDIDYDGTMGMFIAKLSIEAIAPLATVDVIHNNKHGLANDPQLIDRLMKYDLIIVVDSSTNETTSLEGYKDVVIIDHHEMGDCCSVPDNVLLINCKHIKGYESISAGMLVYLLFRQITNDLNVEVEDHFITACATLYSDIVPVDDMVSALIDKFMVCDKVPKLIKAMNTYRNPLNKTLFQWELIPLVNYTRRLEDNASLQTLITDGMEEYATNNLKNNRKRAKTLIDLMFNYSNKRELNNFTLIDITNTLKLSNEPLKNFKGLLSNQFVKSYKKPAVTGYTNPQDNKFYFSVRSPGVNSLDYFKSIRLEGGGHKFANGFSANIKDLKMIFEGFDSYLVKQEEEESYIKLSKIEDLKDVNIWEDVIRNEKAFSNIKPVKYLVENANIGVTTTGRKRNIIDYKGIPFVTYNKLTGAHNLLITPTLNDFNTKSFELIAEIV